LRFSLLLPSHSLSLSPHLTSPKLTRSIRDRFERELEALRKELAEAGARSPVASPALTADDTADDTSVPVSPLLEPAETPSPPLLPTLGAPLPAVPVLETMLGANAAVVTS
jgi:hypothetical protein